jgi:hypothetical protein
LVDVFVGGEIVEGVGVVLFGMVDYFAFVLLFEVEET